MHRAKVGGATFVIIGRWPVHSLLRRRQPLDEPEEEEESEAPASPE